MSHEEHKSVIVATVDCVGGRVPVIAGTGSNSTEEAVQLTRFAKKAGADASLSVVPYYNKPTQAGLYAHFKMIAQKSSLPIVLYNIPGRSGVGLNAKTISALAKIDLIVAIKEATGSMDMASEILRETDLTVLSGDDSLTLPLMALGARGVISVFANIFPAELTGMVNACMRGDWNQARQRHRQMFRLCKTLFIETNPIPVKTAMKILRRDTGEMRLPLCPMDKKNLAALKRELAVYKRLIA